MADLRTGLCSVTYRALPAEEVVQLAADCGLSAIEWGGDVHAPPEDLSRLRHLGELTPRPRPGGQLVRLLRPRRAAPNRRVPACAAGRAGPGRTTYPHLGRRHRFRRSRRRAVARGCRRHQDRGRVGERVCALHVFSWWPGVNRLALAERSQLWQRVFALAHDGACTWETLLEFVPGDDPALLAAEAATLRQLIDEARHSLVRSANEKRE